MFPTLPAISTGSEDEGKEEKEKKVEGKVDTKEEGNKEREIRWCGGVEDKVKE